MQPVATLKMPRNLKHNPQTYFKGHLHFSFKRRKAYTDCIFYESECLKHGNTMACYGGTESQGKDSTLLILYPVSSCGLLFQNES